VYRCDLFIFVKLIQVIKIKKQEQMDELKDSIKFVMDSVQQTLTAVQRQQTTLEAAVGNMNISQVCVLKT
jgi:hypothetical protein